ncbi:hypothetical protein L6452_26058 [Arctium lappa]|uniref:Uncharacterized protein n=1 Tax=Arctium lappa TaxID=4217 RepID=A0ACB9ACA3_ARCLA|nr:hypothetical protein L6452_26058 [Arctium lappa]
MSLFVSTANQLCSPPHHHHHNRNNFSRNLSIPTKSHSHITDHQSSFSTVSSWTSSIARYCRSGRLDHAAAEFTRMRLAGLQPNHITFVTLLSSCADFPLHALSFGVALHALVCKLGFDMDNVKVGTAIIDMYCKCNRLDLACLCFEKMGFKNKKLMRGNSLPRLNLDFLANHLYFIANIAMESPSSWKVLSVSSSSPPLISLVATCSSSSTSSCNTLLDLMSTHNALVANTRNIVNDKSARNENHWDECSISDSRIEIAKVMRAKDLEARFDKKVRTRVLASMLTCKICNKLIKESTAIADCLHSSTDTTSAVDTPIVSTVGDTLIIDLASEALKTNDDDAPGTQPTMEDESAVAKPPSAAEEASQAKETPTLALLLLKWQKNYSLKYSLRWTWTESWHRRCKKKFWLPQQKRKLLDHPPSTKMKGAHPRITNATIKANPQN